MDRQEELHRIKTIPPEVILEDLNEAIRAGEQVGFEGGKP